MRFCRRIDFWAPFKNKKARDKNQWAGSTVAAATGTWPTLILIKQN